VITQPNRPPTAPIITGPTNGTKNTMYTYTAFSTDADNDTIHYTFDWGEPVSPSSGFLPNGSSFTVNHSWATPGRYNLTVTVTDNQTESSSKITVFINTVKTLKKTPGIEPVFLISAIIVAVICAIIVTVLLWKKKRIV
jgi:hypothetical protein